MNDRPTSAELIDAVRLFLEKELLPTLSDARLRFQTLVAANVLSIAEREMATEEEHLREEWSRLTGFLDRTEPRPGNLTELRKEVRAVNDALCDRIRSGDFDDPDRFQSLARHLRQQVMRKLEVANPRYLASSV